MNPLYVKFATGLLRRLLQSSGLLLTVSDSQLTEVVVALATIVGFAWGFWKDFKDQQKLNTAAAMSRGTVAQVEAAIKDGEAASALTPKTQIPS